MTVPRSAGRPARAGRSVASLREASWFSLHRRAPRPPCSGLSLRRAFLAWPGRAPSTRGRALLYSSPWRLWNSRPSLFHVRFGRTWSSFREGKPAATAGVRVAVAAHSLGGWNPCRGPGPAVSSRPPLTRVSAASRRERSSFSVKAPLPWLVGPSTKVPCPVMRRGQFL